MAEVIVLEDGLRPDGRYCVHLMSNAPIQRELPAGVRGVRSVDAGAHVLRAEWRFRGPCEIVYPDIEWRRVVVLWALEQGERISEQAVEAARVYRSTFEVTPMYVWVERLPKGVELGTVIRLPIEPVVEELEDELILIDADWVPRGFLAVERGGMQPWPPALRGHLPILRLRSG